MWGKAKLISFAPIWGMLPTPAGAVCYYNGELYAKTTIDQEFRDSPVVVLAKVVAMINYRDPEGFKVRYELRLVDRYKGHIPHRFWLMSNRDSGGFYLEGTNGKIDPERHYLLFLQYARPNRHRGSDSFNINYSCGQSKPWDEVTVAQRRALRSHRISTGL